jgi:hypothetical protein
LQLAGWFAGLYSKRILYKKTATPLKIRIAVFLDNDLPDRGKNCFSGQEKSKTNG